MIPYEFPWILDKGRILEDWRREWGRVFQFAFPSCSFTECPFLLPSVSSTLKPSPLWISQKKKKCTADQRSHYFFSLKTHISGHGIVSSHEHPIQKTCKHWVNLECYMLLSMSSEESDNARLGNSLLKAPNAFLKSTVKCVGSLIRSCTTNCHFSLSFVMHSIWTSEILDQGSFSKMLGQTSRLLCIPLT